MFIYKITNRINSKVYIGQSIRPVEKRFQRHISDAINNVIDTHFARAIRKYGANNFDVEVIDTAQTQDELTTKEQYWIKYYNSTEVGYNETDAQYKSGGNTYQSKNQNEMAVIKERLSQSKLGTNNPNCKAVKCKNVKTNQEIVFNTVKECQEYFNENTHRFITTRVTHNTFSLYKNEWAIAYLDQEYYYEEKHKRGCMVQVYNNITDETHTYWSKREAERETGIPCRKIKDDIATYENYTITILN